jgi:polysaccharide deacetylase family protein (PEP-CTERM system associated)
MSAPARNGRVVNAMTIDVEDYFHVSVFDGTFPRHEWVQLESRVSANTERLLSIFEEQGVRATFFVLGWVADRFPALVERIAALGHEIASHGYAHRLVYDQTPGSFREDVRRAKALLEDVSGRPVFGFRAPSYSVTPKSLWALDILIEEGYRYDTSIFPIRHDRYGIPLSPRHAYVLERPGGSLIEVPASTVACGPLNLPIGGGG